MVAEQSPDLSQLRVFCMNAQGAALAVHACSLYLPEAAFAAAEQVRDVLHIYIIFSVAKYLH